MTRAAFENAMVIVMALGGSTNAVLHLLAMARACHVHLSLDDFQVSRLHAPVLDMRQISVHQSRNESEKLSEHLAGRLRQDTLHCRPQTQW